MKTIGERIKQAREAKGWSGEQLAHKVGYKTQSGISNLEGRATGTGGNKIVAIAEALEVPITWLMHGPDSDAVPFLSHDDRIASANTSGSSLIATERFVQQGRYLSSNFDQWTAAALEIMTSLDPVQRAQMVAKMREYKQFLGPPRQGQALSVAG
jgi:transcriptional regulator with XRE-family HTH domain